MALHTELQIYKTAYDLLNAITDLAKNMPRDFKASIGGKLRDEAVEITVLVFRANCAKEKAPHIQELLERQQVAELLIRQAPADEMFETANSYYGLLRQASKSHHDRTQLSNILRYRGHAISGGLMKTYRMKTT